MTVGEVIALLATYCSNVDDLLMCRSIYDIEVDDDSIIVYTKNGDIVINRE